MTEIAETPTAETVVSFEPSWRRARGTVPPYLSWCMVVRNSKLDLLEQTFKSLRERAPDSEIVVVETCGRNAAEILALCRRYADVFEQWRGPRGEWNEEMLAVDDMAVARQRSFEIASGRWRAWVDDDDRIPSSEEAKAILIKNGRFRPPVREEASVRDGDEKSYSLEEWLRMLEEKVPAATLVYCPYLYRKDDDGHALEWLERERFARWDDPTRFRWSEPAHEILVPTRSDYRPPRVELPHLLWIHEKKWTPEAYEYSLKRHSAIVLAQYDAGGITFRRARYLAGWASGMASLGLAHREREFLEKSLEVAYTWLDRYRAHVALGMYWARRGLHWDARDHFASAQAISPGLPDAWYAEGQAAIDREDWGTAVTVLRKGVECKVTPESEVNPRLHAVTWPSRLAIALQRVAELYRSIDANASVAALDEARQIACKVLNRPEVGEDVFEANLLFCRAENMWNSELTVVQLHRAWQHLRRNDESQKAMNVVLSLPHDQQHHPLAVEMETWAFKIRRHEQDPSAYDAFYNDSQETGWTPFSAEQATYERAHVRAKWAIDRILKQADGMAKKEQRITVIDLGCCDGIVGLPLLLEAEKRKIAIDYLGVDVGGAHLDNFVALLGKLSLCEMVHESGKSRGTLPGGSHVALERGSEPHDERQRFDAVLLGEIIEHVPDPVDWLYCVMRDRLVEGGKVYLSTPWGSFDDGHPPAATAHGNPRDERGHLRAYSAWKLVQDVREARGIVEEVEHLPVGAGGDAMCAVVRLDESIELVDAEDLKSGDPPGLVYVGRDGEIKRESIVEGKARGRPIAVAVSGALWDWNGSKVDREGIGASEEMIVRMGEKLAPERDYDVFGPTPEEEVYRGVAYFKREAVRKAPKDALLLVSRSPSYVAKIDEWSGHERDAVLWLQDTHYHDLTPEVARRYRKIVCVSGWHAELVARATFGEAWRQEFWPPSEGGTGRIVSIYNWVDRGHFEDGMKTGWKGIKEGKHFIYPSSPDRGLVKLLELWPRVLEMYPDATLSVFYGWKGAAKLGNGGDAGWNQRYLRSRRRYEELRWQKGVQEVGMVDHYRIALEFQRATALLYPTVFTETFCTNAAKARAAGCVPVTTALAALNESARCPQATLVDKIEFSREGYEPTYGAGYDDAWLEGVRRAVELSTEERQAMASEALEKFSWEAVRPKWEEILR